MTEQTYTDRKLKELVLKRKESNALIAEGGEGCIALKEVLDILDVGDPYILEVKGFNRIAGFMVNGEWYGRKSDQEIEAEDKQMIADAHKKHVDYVESQREDWTKREAALPDWAKEILQANRLSAEERGEDFDTRHMGWGYTLIALELAVLYASDESLMARSKAPTYFELPEHILQFHEKNGLSGNQDDWAWYVARNHAKISVTSE